MDVWDYERDLTDNLVLLVRTEYIDGVLILNMNILSSWIKEIDEGILVL
jgi:hypothetical protein